jgi:hypothetical protein
MGPALKTGEPSKARMICSRPNQKAAAMTPKTANWSKSDCSGVAIGQLRAFERSPDFLEDHRVHFTS